MKIIFSTLMSCLPLLLAPAVAHAQFDPGTGPLPPSMQGGTPAASYALSDIEHLNLYNGILNVSLPLHPVQGRGSAGYTITLPIQAQWDAYATKETTGALLYSVRAAQSLLPVGYPGMLAGNSQSYTQQSCPSGGSATGSKVFYMLYRFTWTSPSGTQTELDSVTTPGAAGYSVPCDQSTPNGTNRGTVFEAADGSGMKFVASAPIIDDTNGATPAPVATGTLYFRDGTRYTISGGYVQSIEDHNGNITSFSYPSGSEVTATDSEGRTSTVSISGSTTTVTYGGVGPATRTITINSVSLSQAIVSGDSVQTISCLFAPVVDTAVYNPSVVSSVTLPDQTTYRFLYDRYGEPAQITLPTGGQIRYTWPLPSSCGNNAGTGFLESANPVVHRLPSQREILPDGVHVQGITTYTFLANTYGYSTDTTKDSVAVQVKDYDSTGTNLLRSTTHYYFGTPLVATYGPLPPYGWSDPWYPGQEYQTDISNGSTVVQSTKMLLQQGPCSSDPNQLSCGATLSDGADPGMKGSQICQTNTTNNNAQTRGQVRLFDEYNNLTDLYELDWGNAPSFTSSTSCPTSVSNYTRHTQTTYETGGYTGATVNLVGLPAETKVYAAGGVLNADTQFSYDQGTVTGESGIIEHDNTNYGGSALRGNLTTEAKCSNASSCTWLDTKFTYDIAGNLLSMTDANGHSTSYGYSDNFSDGTNRNTYANLTTKTNALGQPAHWQWDFNTGQPTTATDIDSVNTIYSYTDPLDRLTQMRQAAGLTNFETQTNIVYTSPTDVNVCNDQNAAGDELLRTETVYDGFGRVVATNTYETGQGSPSCESSGSYIQTTKSYDALGRVATTTNPSRPLSNDGLAYVTTYAYDALGRTLSVTTSDGAVAQTSYTGYYTTYTDQAGNSRVIYTDGLGRLSAVWENPSALNYETTYAYDALNDLTQVNQGGETRSFTYDGLGRLTKSVQPESGTMSYSYDSVGNLLKKTDARSITTSYSYDAVNRTTQKTYSDGTPAVTYGYDAAGAGYSWGRLTSISNSNSTTTNVSIDPLGRVTASNQQTGGAAFGFTYYYNRAGSLYYETYPSGRAVSTSYDGANRTSAVAGTYGGAQTSYVTGVNYYPHGAFSSFTAGNSLVPVWTYNSRLQMNALWVTIGNNPNDYLFLEDPINYGATTNNGNVLSIVEYAGGPGTLGSLPAYGQSFGYDALNRISSASDSGGWSRTFAYDRYGNGWVPSASGMGYTLSTPDADVYNSKNQIGSSPYDASGNMLALPPGYTFTYDAENRQVSETNSGGLSANYYYDGDGKRVEKVLNNGQEIVYVYDALENLAAEYDLNPSPSVCNRCFLSYDHLGSVRMVTDENANVVARHDYLPFGDEVPGGIAGRSGQFDATDYISQRFTGKERDTETSLDFFQARFYALGIEKFMSVDPGNAGADPADPESWNAYLYAGNNPLSRTDPDGLDYSVCVNDENGGQQCTYIANDQSFQQSLQNPGSGITISGDNGSGTIYATDQNGNQIQVGTYQHFIGPGTEGGGLQEDFGTELAILSLGRGVASLFGGAGASAATQSALWSMAPTVRGGVIEEMLGANLPRTFPVIDSFADGIATSIKSVDLTAATYQAPNALESRLMGFVDKLANFSGGRLGDAAVDAADISGRVLKLAVPDGGVSAAQQAVISRVTAAAAEKGVQVVVVGVR